MDNLENHTENHTIEMLQKIHQRLEKLDSLEKEVREGFSAIKSHNAGFAGDVYSYERRLINLEDEFLKLKRKIEQLHQ